MYIGVAHERGWMRIYEGSQLKQGEDFYYQVELCCCTNY